MNKDNQQAIGVQTDNVISALLLFASGIEKFQDFQTDKFNAMPINDKRERLWTCRHLLLASTFYVGIYQALLQEKAIRKQFKKELAYINQQLQIAKLMLADPKIQAILFDVDEQSASQSVVH